LTRSVVHGRLAALFGVCLLVGLPTQMRAQGAPPPAPDTILPASAGRPAYLQSLHEVAAPVMLGTRPFRVLLAPAATAATLDELDLADSLAHACPAALPPLPAGHSSGGVAVDASKFLVVLVSSAPSVGDSCEVRWNDGALASWSGLSFASGDAQPNGAPHAMRLLANGIEVPPVYSVARRSLELRNGTWVRGATLLRYYYPMSVLASSSNGGRPELAVQVWPTSGAPTSFELPKNEGERMQYAYAVWRLATTTGPSTRVSIAPRHPLSPVVRAAFDLAAVGKADSGALRAAELLSVAPSGRENEYQRDVASMLVAEVLRQRGDSGGMRGIVASVRARRECLAPPRGASTALTQAIVGVRSTHCPEHNPLATLGAGVVFPGGGHYMHASTLTGIVATAAITSVFVSAYSADAGAKRTYARYESTKVEAQATELFRQANQQRSTARARARVGLVVWGADAVLASVMTFALNRGVARDRH
jgi:hypothetical protein